MIYECPRCKVTLPPNSTSCPNCSLQFEAPIPADATVPPLAPPPVQEPPPITEMPPIYVATPTRNPLIIVVPLALIAIVAAIFIVRGFSGEAAPASSTPAAQSGPVVKVPPAQHISVAPNLAPVTLSAHGGGGGTLAIANSVGPLVGRWQSQTGEIYVFSSNGSGYRIGPGGKGKRETFTWTLAKNTLTLHAGKTESLAYSGGADPSTIFLRFPDGRYKQFARSDAG